MEGVSGREIDAARRRESESAPPAGRSGRGGGGWPNEPIRIRFVTEAVNRPFRSLSHTITCEREKALLVGK